MGNNVKSMPTRPNGEQPWKCEVCGAVLAYSQPINFKLMVTLGQIFTNWHEENCSKPTPCAHPENEGGCVNCSKPASEKGACRV